MFVKTEYHQLNTDKKRNRMRKTYYGTVQKTDDVVVADYFESKEQPLLTTKCTEEVSVVCKLFTRLVQLVQGSIVALYTFYISLMTLPETA